MAREFQFYIIPTPIGNLGDITLRALDILKSVDIIACEDTRTTQKLLNHYGISTKCYSYHKYNEKERVGFFKDLVNEGKKIALVSDAGTPMICDPGSVLIEELIKEGITITSLPGACAITTFLAQVPRTDEFFTFIGFIPRTKSQIQELAKKYIDSDFIFYEAPERIVKTLCHIKEARGNVKIALGRELSKLFEEINIGTIDEVCERYKDEIKGEIVCMIYRSENCEDDNIQNRINILKSKGYKPKDISIILSSLYNINKNKAYSLALEN